MGWLRDTFFGGAEKDAGKRAAEAATAQAEGNAAALQQAGQIVSPAIDEAARLRADAAQRAVDLELAGLGDAQDIFQGIVDQTYDVGTALLNQSIGALREGGEGQRRTLEKTYDTALGFKGQAEGALKEGGEKQRQALMDGYASAVSDYTAGVDSAKASLGAGFSDALNSLDTQYASAEAGFRGAIADGRQLVERELAAGKDALSGFEGGKEAFRLQLAMTGALGAPAQQQFFDQYQSSPATAYKLEQAARLVGSGASGGNKMRRLQELGLGIVSQELDTHFQQLGTLSERSQRQDEDLANLGANYSSIFGDLASAEAQGIGNIRTGLGDAKASIQTEQGLEMSRLDAEKASYLGDLGAAKGAALGASLQREGEGLSGINQDFIGTTQDLGTAYGRSLADQAEGASRVNANAIPVLTDFQKYVADGQVGLSAGRTDIIAGLERELGEIEAGRVTDQAGLSADVVTGQAANLGAGRVDAADARNAGRIGGADVTRGTVTDIAGGIGSLAAPVGTDPRTLSGDITNAANAVTGYLGG